MTGIANTTSMQVEESRYLPKRQLETTTEYQKRLDMTPFFPEMPGILQSRQGAIFRKPPDVVLPDTITYLSNGIIDVIAKVSEFVQTGGFAGVCLDRGRLPYGIDPNNVSQAVVDQLGVGRINLAPYAAHQIRDYAHGTDGNLLWVKVVEKSAPERTWDKKPKNSWLVRIVDRIQIQLYRVTKKKKAGDYDLDDLGAVKHGATDELGMPKVPFVLFNAFVGRDGIGRSNLRASAEADISATRMLSELLWELHMKAPILMCKTDRDSEDNESIRLGSSYVNYLRTTENLEFVKQDPATAQMLFQMYERLVSAARLQANKSADAGVAAPIAQSGISKAWTFKTGEERVLFLLSICLQSGFKEILTTAARMSGADDATVSIKFPPSYDIIGVAETIAIAREEIDLFAAFNLPTVVSHVLSKAALAAMVNAPEADLNQARAELDALAKTNLTPAAQFAAESIRVQIPPSD